MTDERADTMTDDAISEEMVEAAARAGFAVHAEHHGLEPDASFDGTRGKYWRTIARAALAAIRSGKGGE